MKNNYSSLCGFKRADVLLSASSRICSLSFSTTACSCCGGYGSTDARRPTRNAFQKLLHTLFYIEYVVPIILLFLNAFPRQPSTLYRGTVFAIGRVAGLRTGTLPLEGQAYDRKSRDATFREASLLSNPRLPQKKTRQRISILQIMASADSLPTVTSEVDLQQGNEESGDAPSGFILKLFQMVSGPDEIISVSSILLRRFRPSTRTIRIVASSMSIIYVNGFESRDLC